ncbi:hypothetical protein ABT299_20135 [Spirillospora sp. NPDC000708]
MTEPTNVETMLWETVRAYRAHLLNADLWDEFVDFDRYLVANGFREVERKFFDPNEDDE